MFEVGNHCDFVDKNAVNASVLRFTLYKYSNSLLPIANSCVIRLEPAYVLVKLLIFNHLLTGSTRASLISDTQRGVKPRTFSHLITGSTTAGWIFRNPKRG